MENERKKKLLETMKSFNKGQKDSILDFASSSEDVEVFPTGIQTIDDFIGGGTKKGSFSIIYGGYSVGKSTLVLQQIATLQKQGKICCYIDLEHSFDKKRAKELGVNITDLVLAEKCKNAEQALEIIRALCKEKAVDYIAIDSIQAMSPINEQENKGKERQLAEKEIAELARTLSKFFRVVSPDVFNAKVSVVMIGQVRIHGIGTFFTRAGLTGGEALKHWGNLILFMRQGQGTNAPVSKFKRYYLDKDDNLRYKTESDKIGFDCVIKIEKTKSSDAQSEGSDINVPFVFEKGFVDTLEEPEELPIKIAGEGMTSEKIELAKKMLEDKGVLNKVSIPSKVVKDVKDKIKKMSDKEVEEILNDPNSKLVETPMTKEVSEALDKTLEVADEAIKQIEEKPKKKKRGRPKKKKE